MHKKVQCNAAMRWKIVEIQQYNMCAIVDYKDIKLKYKYCKKKEYI